MTATLLPAVDDFVWTAALMSSTTNQSANFFRDLIEKIGSQVGGAKWMAISRELARVEGSGGYTASVPISYVRKDIAQGASTWIEEAAFRDFEILIEEALPRVSRGGMLIRANFELKKASVPRLVGGTETLEE